MKLPPRITVPMLLERKGRRPIVMVTAYDAPQARLVDRAGVDSILVGDSVGMTTLGYDTTLPVTLDVILHHTRAVAAGLSTSETDSTDADNRRGAHLPLLIADLPFGSYGISVEEGVRNGVRLIAEGGAQAVKLEGSGEVARETITRLIRIGVPVMGHVGMTPQSVNTLGGFRVQGKGQEAGERILAECHALMEAGVWGIVLELIPPGLARQITESLPIVTVGIGAGADCDGQVQVLHDLLGLTPGPVLKHTKRYTAMGETITEAVAQFAGEVRSREFRIASPAAPDNSPRENG